MQQEDLECTSNAVRVQLDCCTNIAPNPRSMLLERNSRAVWQVVMLACPRIIKDHQECDWNISNVVGMSYEYLERSWNQVGMQLEYISCWNVVGKFWAWAKHSNHPQEWTRIVGMQLEVLECSWNIQEWTKNFHSNCIPVHSSSSVIGVLRNSSQNTYISKLHLEPYITCSSLQGQRLVPGPHLQVLIT